MNYNVRLPCPFRILALVVGALGVGLLVAAWVASPPQLTIQIALLGAAALLSENFSLSLPRYSVSLAYPLTIAAIVLTHSATAAMVAALSAITFKDLRASTPPSVMFFNLGQLLTVTIAGSWVYAQLGGQPLLGFWSTHSRNGVGDISMLMLPLTALALVCVLGNMGVTGLALGALRRQRFGDAFATVAWLFPSQCSLAFVGFLIARVLAISPWALPFLIAPLMVARQVYQRYTQLNEAYSDTVRSLVGALEAKDAYTRGHSERVADYSIRLGLALGMDARSLERLEYSALLHDLGKIALPSEILGKPSPLSHEETQAVRNHPARGASMVAKIPPLRDLASNVGKHHEWYGGGGYPTGDSGAQIPGPALILAVADCYDAMTTTRAYRPALSHEMAIAELKAGSGTQFDPAIVDAFICAGIGEPASESRGSERSGARGAAAVGEKVPS